MSLQYGSDWIASGFALSEDLPLTDLEHRPRGRLLAGAHVAVGAVDDARPDRWGERVIRFVDQPRRHSLMEYLSFAGDDRFGALGVSTSDTQYQPREGGPLPRLEQAQELSEVAAKIAGAEPITQRERAVIRAGGSFGGAKPKALIEIAGEEWTVKFSTMSRSTLRWSSSRTPGKAARSSPVGRWGRTPPWKTRCRVASRSG